MISFTSLRTPVTRAQALVIIQGVLTEVGFNATSWQSGSVQLSFLAMCAHIYSRFSEYVAAILEGGFLLYSRGDWLTHLADSEFDCQRRPGVTAQHRCVLTCSAGTGPYTIAVGGLVAADTEVTYRNITGGTITSGGTLVLTLECETAGAKGNAVNDTITSMVTTYAGVTITNPAYGADGRSVIRSGFDEETDAVLIERCRTRWAALSVETTADKVTYYSLLASQAVHKVLVDGTNPRGAGTVDVYVAKLTGGVPSSDVTLVETELWKHFIGDNVPERIRAYSATAQTFNPAGNVYITANSDETIVRAAVEASLLAMLGTVPIGGTNYSPGPQHILTLGDILAAIESVPGVISVTLSSPTSNVSVGAHSVLVPPATWALVYRKVTTS